MIESQERVEADRQTAHGEVVANALKRDLRGWERAETLCGRSLTKILVDCTTLAKTVLLKLRTLAELNGFALCNKLSLYRKSLAKCATGAIHSVMGRAEIRKRTKRSGRLTAMTLRMTRRCDRPALDTNCATASLLVSASVTSAHPTR